MDIVPDIDLLFRDWIAEQCRREHVRNPLLPEYLTSLLAGFLRRSNIPKVLHPKIYKYSNAPSRHLRKIHFIGDSALFTAGVLSPFSSDKHRDIRYYIAVAQCAFELLLWDTQSSDKFYELYRAFSKDIRLPVEVLMGVSVENIFRHLPREAQSELYARFILSRDETERGDLVRLLTTGFLELDKNHALSLPYPSYGEKPRIGSK